MASLIEKVFAKLRVNGVPSWAEIEHQARQLERDSGAPDTVSVPANMRFGPIKGARVPVRVKLLDRRARVPQYASSGACAVDLRAVLNKPVHVRPGMVAEIRTGLAFEVAPGWRLELASRSGYGRKFGVRLANCTGYIDSDYRGEVIVCLTADYGRSGVTVKPGERIAQLMASWSPRIEFEVVDSLTPTERGAGGFGSTGRA